MSARRALLVLVSAALVIAGVPGHSDGDEHEGAALKAALDQLREEHRTVETELREAIAKARAIGTQTPLEEREAIAKRIVALNDRLKTLAERIEAARQAIAAFVEWEWHVVTVTGVGLTPSSSPPALIRRRYRDDTLVRIRRGESLQPELARIRADVSTPHCGGVSTREIDFWEHLTLSTAGPFRTRQEAAARARPRESQVVHTLAGVDVQAVAQRFCSGRPPTNPVIPNIAGRPADEVVALLRREGLVPHVLDGTPPTAPQQQGLVERSRPAPGETAAIGSTVTVWRHPAYVDAGQPIPDVGGRLVNDAEYLLGSVGLAVERRETRRAPSRDQEWKVFQQTPLAGSRLKRGERVVVEHYGAYIPTPQEQVAAASCPPNSQAFWDAVNARPACRCVAGFVAHGNACVIDRNTAVAQQQCPVNAQAYWDDRAGGPRCRCLAGFVAHGHACVVDRHAAVAQLQCPLNAESFWDDRAGRANCRCNPGHTWNGSACVIDRNAAVAQLQCPANAEGFWDDRAGRANCRCKAGHTWNGSACVIDRNAAVAQLQCPANAEGFWDDRAGRANCRCRAGHTWNGQTCVRPAGPPPAVSTPAPANRNCPPGYVFKEWSLLGQDYGSGCVKR